MIGFFKVFGTVIYMAFLFAIGIVAAIYFGLKFHELKYIADDLHCIFAGSGIGILIITVGIGIPYMFLGDKWL